MQFTIVPCTVYSCETNFKSNPYWNHTKIPNFISDIKEGAIISARMSNQTQMISKLLTVENKGVCEVSGHSNMK